VGSGKVFIDGVIESRTAALLEPYTDRGDDAGTPRVEAPRLAELVQALAEAGFGFHGHAIGDRAVRMGLDAVEAAGGAAQRRPLRHLLAHIELIHPDDVPRFRRLGVAAGFQPLWAYADAYITELTWPGIGPERARWVYPMRSVAAAGGRLAFGSDWTVSSLQPLRGIQVAVTRRNPSEPGEVIQPDQRDDQPTALAASTLGSAWALGHEDETGSIEVGKRADLVLLARDPFEVAPEEIGAIGVRATLLDGEPVFLAEGVEWPESERRPSP
jgi:predicted amidohydrolase YtcJ